MKNKIKTTTRIRPSKEKQQKYFLVFSVLRIGTTQAEINRRKQNMDIQRTDMKRMYK